MKLPADLFIAPEKLTDYLLVWQRRGDKSGFLAKAGYDLETTPRLEADLRRLAAQAEAVHVRSNAFGDYYETDGDLGRPQWCPPARKSHLDERTLVRPDQVHYADSRLRTAMTFPLYTDMILAADLPGEGLRRGDIVKLVDHHLAPDGSEAYSVEFFNALGETSGVACVPVRALRMLDTHSVLTARELAVPA